MRKRRFQKGSLQQVRRGKAKRWVVLYYNAEGKRQYHTLLGGGSMTKTQAETERDEFMRTINGSDEPGPRRLRAVTSERVYPAALPALPAKEVEGVHGGHVRESDPAPYRKGNRRQAMRDFLADIIAGIP